MESWTKQLLPIIEEYKDGDLDVKLSLEDVANLCLIIKAKINLQEGNITEEQYHAELDDRAIHFSEVENAKKILKVNGYFTDNLWCVQDVKDAFECTDEQAQSVLDDALTNEATMEQIQFSIREFSNLLGLKKIIN